MTGDKIKGANYNDIFYFLFRKCNYEVIAPNERYEYVRNICHLFHLLIFGFNIF